MWLSAWATETWQLTVEAAPWLLGGFLLAGVIHALAPIDRVTRHLGKPGLAGVVKASLIGIPLPLCSCSVIPVASAIRQRGAGRGAFVSFLISTPETGVDSMAISYALLGPLLTIVRPITAFVTAIAAGLLVDAGESVSPPSATDAETLSESGEAGDRDACGCSTAPSPGPRAPALSKLRTALHYGLVELFVDLAPWLIAGFALAGAAAAALPQGFLERHVGSGIGPMLLMLIVGLPLYVCATSSTPIAAALIARGLSPGAALVFLLVGPATNIATMLVVARETGRRGLGIYLGVIAVVAVGAGLFVDQLAPALPAGLVDLPSCDDNTIPTMGWGFALALTVLILNGLRIRLLRRQTPPTSNAST